MLYADGLVLDVVVAEILPGLKTIGSSALMRLAFRCLRQYLVHSCIFSWGVLAMTKCTFKRLNGTFCVPKIRKAAKGTTQNPVSLGSRLLRTTYKWPEKDMEIPMLDAMS